MSFLAASILPNWCAAWAEDHAIKAVAATAAVPRNFAFMLSPLVRLFILSRAIAVLDYVQPRSRNRINNTGMGIPNNHNNTQPTLPSFPRPIVFTISFILPFLL